MKNISRKIVYAITAIILALTIKIFVAANHDTRNAQENAIYIVSQNSTDERIDAELQKFGVVVGDYLNEWLQNYGGTIPDPHKFVVASMGDTLDQVMSLSRADAVPIYLEMFNSRELADIAAFYKTQSGQAFLAQTPTSKVVDGQLQQSSDDIAWQDNLNFKQQADLTAFLGTESGQAFVDAIPVFEQHAAELIGEIGAIVEERITSAGLAELLSRGDFVEFGDPADREAFLEELSSVKN